MTAIAEGGDVIDRAIYLLLAIQPGT